MVIVVISSFFPPKLSASYLSENTVFYKIKNDYCHFYSTENLTKLGIGLSLMGLVANTEIDQNFQDWYQDELRSETTDNFSEITKIFGEGYYLIPISLLSSGLYYFNTNSEIGNWGLNSTRAYIVGLPAMLAAQYITGGSRPDEDKQKGSGWRFFDDSNGVSGHAFVGAVPFLTIAKMNDNKFVKVISYIASTLTAWSRIDDNSHYMSQSLLGWYMAYESVNSVFSINQEDEKISFTPIVAKDFYGIVFSAKW